MYKVLGNRSYLHSTDHTPHLCSRSLQLFELRVVRQLGIVVNIILNITRSISWFFLIFALILVSFTHALMHLLHTRQYHPPCPAAGCDEQDEYPTKPFAALSATYFFLVSLFFLVHLRPV